MGLIPQLRYLGAIPRKNYREYVFRIEDRDDKNVRQIILTIDNHLFQDHHLKFQEAPDLCYQKMLMDLSNETAHAPLPASVRVTGMDIADYRSSHPTAQGRKRPEVRNSA